jgi:hypothetical protein
MDPLPLSSHGKPVDAFPEARALESELRKGIRGEVRFDTGSRALYATDASNYRQIPIGLVVPRDADDVISAVAAARKFGAPVLPRGAGTSLAGQCCNVAVVLDFSKYMNKVSLPKTSSTLNQLYVGAVLLVSAHCYVQSVDIRLYRSRFLLPGASRFAIGDSRPAPPDQCAAEVAAWACSPENSGPPLLDVAYALLVRLALSPRHRQARNGDRLAPQGIPAVLDLEE